MIQKKYFQTGKRARPYFSINLQPLKLTIVRPVKHPLILTHVVRDDSHVVTRAHVRPLLPERLPSQRDTWPKPTPTRKPGSYCFDETPTLVRTPWEFDRHRKRPQSQWSRHTASSHQLPARVFEELPQEIYECILAHLEASFETASSVHASSLRRQLQTLCFVSKRWARVAVEQLYRELWLPSCVSTSKRKLSMTRVKGRMDMLIRTLTDAPDLAFLVRRIHVGSALSGELAGSNGQHAMKLLQEVIDRCTEVQAITGFTPPASSDYISYYNSLFTRPRLSAHAWLLDPQQSPVFPVSQFIDFHRQWQWLDTLVLCNTSLSGLSIGTGLLTAVTNKLWSLKHLMVSGFSRQDFHNGTLLLLPPLESLRLENLDGVTDQGIEQLALSRMAFSLQSLSLVDLDLLSLRTIQAVFARLPHLLRFRLVQDSTPAILIGTHPSSKRAVLACSTLRHLHWDTLFPGPAIEAIANSVATNNFPSLRTLKAPSDYDGSLQELCRPISQQPLTAGDLKYLDTVDQDRYVRSLRLAKLQAQLRIRESRQQPSFNVVVEDQDEHVQHTHVIGSYLGDMQSAIEYSLEPDVEGSEEALASVADVMTPKSLGAGDRKVLFKVLF